MNVSLFKSYKIDLMYPKWQATYLEFTYNGLQLTYQIEEKSLIFANIKT